MEIRGIININISLIKQKQQNNVFLLKKMRIKRGLTLSSIYTHFNTLKKRSVGKHCGKNVKLLKMSNFTFFHNDFYAIFIL